MNFQKFIGSMELRCVNFAEFWLRNRLVMRDPINHDEEKITWSISVPYP